MSLVLIIFQGCLVVYLLALLWFLLGLLRSEPPRTDDQPPVSVIVAARNGEPHLSRLLARLLDQDYPAAKMEIVIVDDGLTESSRTVLDEATGGDRRETSCRAYSSRTHRTRPTLPRLRPRAYGGCPTALCMLHT